MGSSVGCAASAQLPSSRPGSSRQCPRLDANGPSRPSAKEERSLATGRISTVTKLAARVRSRVGGPSGRSPSLGLVGPCEQSMAWSGAEVGDRRCSQSGVTAHRQWQPISAGETTQV